MGNLKSFVQPYKYYSTVMFSSCIDAYAGLLNLGAGRLYRLKYLNQAPLARLLEMLFDGQATLITP